MTGPGDPLAGAPGRPGGTPGHQPAGATGHQPASAPGHQLGGAPGHQLGGAPGHRPAGAPGQDPGSADDSRAEVVLSQALRAMAGGRSAPSGTGGRVSRRLSTAQLVLIAAIAGLLVGIGAGLLSLLL